MDTAVLPVGWPDVLAVGLLLLPLFVAAIRDRAIEWVALLTIMVVITPLGLLAWVAALVLALAGPTSRSVIPERPDRKDVI